MEKIPLNTDKDGNASCIRAGYYKAGAANFMEREDGFGQTAVMEKRPMQDWYEEKVGELMGKDGNADELDGEPKVASMPHGYYEGQIVDVVPSLQTKSSQYNNVLLEPQVLNPLKDKTQNGWHFEQQVYDADGIARAVKAGGGSGNVPKVLEPQVLTPKRTEEGKKLRKDYESGKISKKRKEMTTMEPRQDGIANTLTTVQKDNLLAEPTLQIVANTAEGSVELELGGVMDISYPSSTTRRGRVQENGKVTPALTCGCESNLVRVEEQKMDFPLMYQKAEKVLINNEVHDGDTINPYNETLNKTGISPTLTTRPEGNKTAILAVEEIKEPKIIVAGHTDMVTSSHKYCREYLDTGGISKAVCSAAGMGGNMEIKIKEEVEYKGKKFHEGDGLYIGQSDAFMRDGLKDCSRTLKAGLSDAGCVQNYRIRKLTERECFRLMGVIDKDSDKIREVVSRSQCYKLAGNSIVVDCMTMIFEQLFCGNKNNNQQLELF